MTIEEKKQMMKVLQEGALEYLTNALFESQEENMSYNTDKVLQTKFCGVDGVVLFSPAIKGDEVLRKLFIFDTVDKDDKEYDTYFMLYNLKTSKISFVKGSEADLKKEAEAAAKSAGAEINIRDVYAEKDDIKSFFENMNTDVAKIFGAFSNIFGKHEVKDAPKADELKKEEPKKSDDKEEKKEDKKPQKKHADAIHAIVNKAIESSDDAFVGLCKIFAYIEKRGEEEGYEKVISDIKDAMASIKK